MGKKILYVIIIIALIMAGIFVATKIEEKDKTKPVIANTINNKNETKDKNEVKENKIEAAENEVEDNTVKKNTENNEIENENSNISPEEQAKQIVKDNWGEDDTVYYSYDGIKDGKHVVCVREKSTTKELYRYYVDVESGTFEIE